MGTKRKLIAVALLGLVSAQAGVATASGIYADPYRAPRELALSDPTPRVIDAAPPSGYDLVDRSRP